MLDDYIKTQPIIYKILKKSLKNNQISHAYLFEINNSTKSMDFINAFVKSIFCPHMYTNNKNCEKCQQCNVIESGNFPELKIISPDGMWIKKNQLKELKSEFNETALIGNKRVYIIKNAEKLGQSSANTILKFLEEPEDGIIAILITENINSIIETIRSRCQIFRFMDNSKVNKELSLEEKIKQILLLNKTNNNNDIEKEKILKVIEFINNYEKNHIDTLLYTNKIFEYIKTKEDLIDALDIMIIYYKEIIDIKLKKQYKEKNIADSEIIIQNNSINELCRKLNIIIKTKQNVKYNQNVNLLMDRLILDLEGEM